MLLSLPTFTLVHVVISVAAIIAGLVVAGGLLAGKDLGGWAGFFLAMTGLTSLTGFGFPFVTLLPSHAVGILSLILLPLVVVARYWKHLAGPWRRIYVVGAIVVLYLNVFVLFAQLFRRVPALVFLAPQQNEASFLVTQLLVLALFIWLGRAALKGFPPQAADMRAASPAMAAAHR
jgi:hypothetical protein